MINFLLGFWTADLLFSLVFYFKKEIIVNLNQKLVFFSIIVDIFLLAVLFLIKHGQKISRS